MPLLSRDAFLAASPFPRELVTLPELGGDVYVQGLAADALDRFEQSRLRQQKGKVRLDLSNTRARLVSLTVVDELGKRLFAEADIPALGRLPGRILDRVYEVAARLSGIKTEELEDTEKNGSASESSPG